MSSNYKKDVSTEFWDDPKRISERIKILEFIALILNKRGFLAENKILKLLGFPAHYAYSEKLLAELVPETFIEVVGLESNKIVLENLKKTAQKLAPKYANLCIKIPRQEPISLSEYLVSERTLDFDIVFLDYMGTMSTEKIKEITSILRKTSKQFILIINIAIARTHRKIQNGLLAAHKRQSEFNRKDFIAPKGAYEMYRNCFPDFIKERGFLCGKRVHMEMCHHYHNKNRTPQTAFAFHVQNL